MANIAASFTGFHLAIEFLTKVSTEDSKQYPFQ